MVWKVFETKTEAMNWFKLNAGYPMACKVVSLDDSKTTWQIEQVIPKTISKKVKRKHGNPFTEEEKNAMTTLHFEGKSVREIAEEVNRSYGGVYSFVKTLALRV